MSGHNNLFPWETAGQGSSSGGSRAEMQRGGTPAQQGRAVERAVVQPAGGTNRPATAPVIDLTQPSPPTSTTPRSTGTAVTSQPVPAAFHTSLPPQNQHHGATPIPIPTFDQLAVANAWGHLRIQPPQSPPPATSPTTAFRMWNPTGSINLETATAAMARGEAIPPELFQLYRMPGSDVTRDARQHDPPPFDVVDPRLLNQPWGAALLEGGIGSRSAPSPAPPTLRDPHAVTTSYGSGRRWSSLSSSPEFDSGPMAPLDHPEPGQPPASSGSMPPPAQPGTMPPPARPGSMAPPPLPARLSSTSLAPPQPPTVQPGRVGTPAPSTTRPGSMPPPPLPARITSTSSAPAQPPATQATASVQPSQVRIPAPPPTHFFPQPSQATSRDTDQQVHLQVVRLGSLITAELRTHVDLLFAIIDTNPETRGLTQEARSHLQSQIWLAQVRSFERQFLQTHNTDRVALNNATPRFGTGAMARQRQLFEIEMRLGNGMGEGILDRSSDLRLRHAVLTAQLDILQFWSRVWRSKLPAGHPLQRTGQAANQPAQPAQPGQRAQPTQPAQPAQPTGQNQGHNPDNLSQEELDRIVAFGEFLES